MEKVVTKKEKKVERKVILQGMPQEDIVRVNEILFLHKQDVEKMVNVISFLEEEVKIIDQEKWFVNTSRFKGNSEDKKAWDNFKTKQLEISDKSMEMKQQQIEAQKSELEKHNAMLDNFYSHINMYEGEQDGEKVFFSDYDETFFRPICDFASSINYPEQRLQKGI